MAVLAVCAWGAGAQAQVLLDVLSPDKTATPMDIITHTFQLTNQQAVSDTFTLGLTLSPGLTPLGGVSSQTLGPGESAPIFVTVLVTAAALAKQNDVTLTVVSQTNPSVKASATAIINVSEVAGVKLSKLQAPKVSAGSQTQVKFVVLNQGNGFNEFDVEVSSQTEVGLSVQPATLSLLPGETQEVVVLISVPTDIVAQFVDVTLSVISTIFPDVKATLSVTLEVLPPSPLRVSRDLTLGIPLRLDLGVSPLLGTDKRDISIGASADLNLLHDRILSLTFRDNSLINTDSNPLLSLGFQFSGINLGFEFAKQLTATLFVPPITLSGKIAPNNKQVRARLNTSVGKIVVNGDFLLKRKRVSGVPGEQEAVAGSSSVGFPLGPLSFRLSLSRNSPEPLSNRSDQEKFGMSFRFNDSNFGASQDLILQQENRVNDPLFSTIQQNSSVTNLRLDLGGELPRLRLGLKFESITGQGPAATFPIDQSNLDLSFTAQESLLSALDIKWFTESNKIWNEVDGTHTGLNRSSLDLNLDVVVFTVGMRFAESQTKDLVSNAVLDGQQSLSASIRFGSGPMTVKLGVVRTDKGIPVGGIFPEKSFSVNSSLGLTVNGLRFSTLGDIEFSAGKGVLGANLSLEFSGLFNFSTSILVKGQVEGVVFVDSNGNGQRDENEVGVPKSILKIDGMRVSSDDTGFYRFPAVDPGPYLISLEDLPNNLVPAVSLPIAVTLAVGQRLTLDIPLNPVGAIQGIVFNDQNRNGRKDIDELGIVGVAVSLTSIEIEAQRVRTDNDGGFVFGNLSAGTFTLVLDEKTLPKRFESTTPTEVSITLKFGDQGVVNFGAFQKPRPILFAPTADFTIQPDPATVGETVSFDASSSFDLDGQIVKYAWDFDGDGVVDAEGKVVQHVFSNAATFAATLTVTDNDGQIGRKTKSIQVTDN